MKKNLAVAYGIKRNKKMAKGGEVNESAASEKRPMPEEKDKDAGMVSRNDSKKAPSQDKWTDQPTVKQAQMNNGRAVKPIKHPKMVASNVVQSRLRDEEDDLMSSSSPGPYGAQPKRSLNEEDADKSGPDTVALHMKRMAEGGMINDEVSMNEAEEDGAEHPAGLESDDDQIRPAQDEYMADHFAEGGMVEEEAIDHAASIAAAIMAKRKKFARGGEILSEDSMEVSDSDQADLSRNAEEDANMEDKASFDALRKENYSESSALDDLDSPSDSNEHSPEHDEEDVRDRSIVSAIRRKMKSKSPISR